MSITTGGYRNRPDRRRLPPQIPGQQSKVLWSAGEVDTTHIQVGFDSPMLPPPGNALFWRSEDGSAEGQSSACVETTPLLFTFTLPVAMPATNYYCWFEPLSIPVRSRTGGYVEETPQHVIVA